jgi:hypothetical protein
MQSRTLVSCGLVGPDTMMVTASDGEVWLHRVERDELGQPVPGQIDRWLNLLWAPPASPADSSACTTSMKQGPADVFVLTAF